MIHSTVLQYGGNRRRPTLAVRTFWLPLITAAAVATAFAVAPSRAGCSGLASMRSPGRQPVPSTASRLRPGERPPVLRCTAGFERGMRLQPRDLRVDHTRRYLK